MYEGIDVGTSQATLDFTGDIGSYVIVKAGGANVGFYVAPWYVRQVNRARAAGKEVGHYFFNGNRDALDSANFFVDNLHDLQPGDVLVLDIEAEPATKSQAWTPAQALVFARQVKHRTGITVGLYLNLSLMRNSDWSALVDLGCWLWIAYPGADPVTLWWPTWTMWQYTIRDNVDRNRSKMSLAQIRGGGPTKPSSPAAVPSRPAAVPAGKDWDFWLPSKAAQLRVQRALKNRGRYSGKLDGVFGPLSYKGIQLTCQRAGYTGPVDGVIGRAGCFSIQTYAAAFGDYTGPIDRKLGPKSWAGFALGLERK